MYILFESQMYTYEKYPALCNARIVINSTINLYSIKFISIFDQFYKF